VAAGARAANTRAKGNSELADLLTLASAAAASGGGGGGGGSGFVFTPGAPQSGNVYGDWLELGAALALLEPGDQPTVTFTDSFTVPGPIDMRGGTWRSVTFQTGAVTLTLPDGVVIDNLRGITDGIAVVCSPTTADGVFTFSTLQPPGAVKVFFVGLGAILVNFGTKALFALAGGGDFFVYAANSSPRLSFPPDTAPVVLAGAGDGVIGAASGGYAGGFPDGWVVGGVGGILQYQFGIDGQVPLTPGWLGTLPTVYQSARVQNLPVSATFCVVPSGPAGVGGNQFADFASAWAAGLLVPGPKVMQFDDSFAPIDVGPGSYDAREWIFEGRLRGNTPNVIVNLLEGAQFTRPPVTLRYGLTLRGMATATPNILMDNLDVLILTEGGSVEIDGAATAPVLQIDPGPGPDGPFLACLVGGILGSGNGDIEILAGAASVTIILDTLGNLANDSLFGAGSASALVTAQTVYLAGVPLVQTGLAAFQVVDLSVSGLGVRGSWSCESTTLVGAKQVVPPGYSLLTTTNEMWVLSLREYMVSQMVVTAIGDPLNVGITFDVELRVDDIPAPLATITLNADDVPAFGFSVFNVGVSGGGKLTVTLTPSAPLVAPITVINVSLV